MSLTSNIKSQGWLYQLIRKHTPAKFIAQIVNGHNANLAQCSVICAPPGTQYATSGSAMTYALRNMVGLNKDFASTIAGTGARQLGVKHIFNELLNKPTLITERAPLYILLAGLESVGRGRDLPDWFPNNNALKKLPTTELAQLNPGIAPTIEDVNNLLPHMVNDLSTLLGDAICKGNYHLNPTFEGSSLVGGADAQLITGKVLWDVRTSMKRAPFTVENLFQQIGYLVLDYENAYGIETLCWYYTRQGCLLTYSVKDLPIDLEAMREEVFDRDENHGYEELNEYRWMSPWELP